MKNLSWDRLHKLFQAAKLNENFIISFRAASGGCVDARSFVQKFSLYWLKWLAQETEFFGSSAAFKTFLIDLDKALNEAFNDSYSQLKQDRLRELEKLGRGKPNPKEWAYDLWLKNKDSRDEAEEQAIRAYLLEQITD